MLFITISISFYNYNSLQLLTYFVNYNLTNFKQVLRFERAAIRITLSVSRFNHSTAPANRTRNERWSNRRSSNKQGSHFSE